MTYKDMVGHYVSGYDKGMYRIIEWGGRGGHGFYLEAVSSACERPWRDISEAAIDRSYYLDDHPNFWVWRRNWLREHPEIVADIEDGAYFADLYNVMPRASA